MKEQERRLAHPWFPRALPLAAVALMCVWHSPLSAATGGGTARTDRSRCHRRILVPQILAPTTVWFARYASVRATLPIGIVRSLAPKTAMFAVPTAVAQRQESGLPSGDTGPSPGIVELTVDMTRRETLATLRRHGGKGAHRGGMSVACEDRCYANASLRE